jgi:hypothetical protein
VRDVEEKIKMAAQNPTVSPRTVLGYISVTLDNRLAGGTSYMRSKQTINVAIHRQQYTAKGYVSKPKKYDDLTNIPQQLKEINDGCSSLVLNDTVIAEDSSSNAKRILVFLSQHGKEMLSNCSYWYMDRTFKSAASTFFSQIVFIVGLNALGKAVPCAFTLLPNKEKDSYLRLAACIRDELSQLPEVKVKNIMMDYEKGLILAFKTSFPGVSLAGCDFYWKSCLRFFTIQLFTVQITDAGLVVVGLNSE